MPHLAYVVCLVSSSDVEAEVANPTLRTRSKSWSFEFGWPFVSGGENLFTLNFLFATKKVERPSLFCANKRCRNGLIAAMVANLLQLLVQATQSTLQPMQQCNTGYTALTRRECAPQTTDPFAPVDKDHFASAMRRQDYECSGERAATKPS